MAHDHTLGDDPDLANHICVLTITRDDGTPFDTDSLWKEDILELCINLGQAHPKGMLWLLAMELVVTFQSSEDMLATVCLVMMATVWHDVPIKLHTCPPTAIHIRAYMAGRSACPYSTQSPTPEGEVSQLILSDLHPDGRPHTNSTWTSGTWVMPS